MSYISIPLAQTPNQSFSVILDGLSAQIALTTTEHGLFADVIYNGIAVALGRLCLDRVTINPNHYLGLPQFLGFADLQGTTDPVYTGFGARYLLIYGSP